MTSTASASAVNGPDAEQGLLRLRWTDAEHPHRCCCSRDGTTQVLESTPEMLIGDSPDEDSAILAVRADPEDRPRPAEAGPGHLDRR